TRRYVKSAKAQLQNRFGAAVAEVDHHELWQRSRLTVACVAREHGEAARLLEEAVRYLNGQEYELVGVEREVVAPGEGPNAAGHPASAGSHGRSRRRAP